MTCAYNNDSMCAELYHIYKETTTLKDVFPLQPKNFKGVAANFP